MASIVCTAETVKQAASACIEHIIKERERRDEERIAKVMGHKRFVFRKFCKEYPTREEAIKQLDNSGMFGWRSQYAWSDLDHAKKLLTLAEHGDPVTLNEEDSRVLWG